MPDRRRRHYKGLSLWLWYLFKPSFPTLVCDEWWTRTFELSSQRNPLPVPMMVVVVRVRCMTCCRGEWGGVKTSSERRPLEGRGSQPRTLLIIATNRCPLTSGRSRWHAVTRERGRPRCLELQTKVHTKVRHHERGHYCLLSHLRIY